MHMDAEAATIAALPGVCLLRIFGSLTAQELAACMAVNRQWRATLEQEDDRLWRRRCEEEFGSSSPSPVGPDQRPLPSFRAACAQWHPLLRRYGPLALRAARAWDRVRRWTTQHAPAIAASLQPGASEAALDEAERAVGGQLSDELRVLYRIHDGQDLEFDRGVDLQRSTMGPSLFHGLLGSYSFYNHVVSTRMLPLRRLVAYTRRFKSRTYTTMNSQEHPTRVLFAASYNMQRLVFCFLGLGDVQIAGLEHIHGFPGVRTGAPTNGAPSTSVLRWFEAYADALAAGVYAARRVVDELPESCGIVLFPRRPPGEVEAVTAGIKICAAPLFVPEMSTDEGGLVATERYFFAYRVRMSLLPEAEQAAAGAERPLRSVQLLSRRWVIRGEAEEEVDVVEGEGVVGHYPLLTAGGPEFEYQSCTHQPKPVGTMDGHFTFVEGSLEEPSGRQVQAEVPRMHFALPDILF